MARHYLGELSKDVPEPLRYLHLSSSVHNQVVSLQSTLLFLAMLYPVDRVYLPGKTLAVGSW